jgi:D-xylose transport system substrate-binding protein
MILAFVLAIMMLGGCTAKAKDSGGARKTKRSDIVIGVSWRSLQEERWVTELNVMQQYCESQGMKLIYQVSENDAQRQSGQIENLVSQGVDILIATSNEKGVLDNALKDAAAEGVLVCYYEQVDGETYFDISGGNEQFEIGQAITRTIGNMGITGNVAYLLGDSTGGTGVIKFYDGMKDSMKNCNVTVVGEQWITNWDPATGMAHAENWIAQYGDSLTAILCMNDGLAGGAVQALTNAGLAGKVLTCGMDCDLLAIQRILAGTQVSTVLKSGVEYPRQFIETSIKYYLGELKDSDFEHTDTNSLGQTKPFMLYPATVVTKDNIDEVVIAAGIYTHEEVYGNKGE